jgi:hypothetical protein
LQAITAVGLLWISTVGSAAEDRGATIYRENCAECHGKQGEGVRGKYDDPLAGNRSVQALARLISKTMPEGKEGTCVGPDAEAVAAYIHSTFYSPEARASLNPVRESLARLTVTQYQNSVADLVGRFRPGFDRPPGPERGLRGVYSGFAIPTPEEEEAAKEALKKKEKKDRKAEKLDRLDPQISFHFGEESPQPDKMIPSEFNIRWNGSLIAPETGLYEFVVKSENGIRLWVNDTEERPLIDSWVTPSQEVREEKKSLFLLGGRTYRFAVAFLKYKDKSASIEVWWRPPHGVLEPLPQSALMPQEVRQSMVLTTALPADDRSDGYERGTTISKEWDQATTAGALEVLEHIDAHVDNLAGTKPGAPDRTEKFKEFSRRFLETAFRRPLTPEQKESLVERTFEKSPTPVLAVKRVALFALKSPRFLYPSLAGGDVPDDFTVADRLAEVLWDSIPDAALWKAAEEGKLRDKDQIEKAARRMLADPRAKAKLLGFFHQWLDLERADHALKDASLFPQFNEATRADLRQSLRLFLDETVWSDASDYRQLLQAPHLWLNRNLGGLYGVSVAGNGFEKVVPATGERSGVLTHPYILSALAYHKTTSPIHRGVFLSRSIVGIQLKNPSVAVAFEDAKFDPSLTMREKVTDLTKNKSCTGCHGVINPLGFALENFDAIGRWREEDNHKPVDPAVSFEGEDGTPSTLNSAPDVARLAVSSPKAHEAFVRQLFLHCIKQPPAAFGPRTEATLARQFESGNFHIQNLLVQIALTKALQGLPPEHVKVAGTPR